MSTLLGIALGYVLVIGLAWFTLYLWYNRPRPEAEPVQDCDRGRVLDEVWKTNKRVLNLEQRIDKHDDYLDEMCRQFREIKQQLN